MDDPRESMSNEVSELSAQFREALEEIAPGGNVVDGDDRDAALLAARSRLEEMFDDPGLRRLRKAKSSHPAVPLYDSISTVAESGGTASWPNEMDDLKAMWRTFLDLSTWTPESLAEDVWSGVDPDAKRWLVPSLRDPNRFEDVISELFAWGRLRQAGYDAALIEEDGFPDIRLNLDDRTHFVEVKRIRLGSSSQRKLKKLIGDANKKIRRADPHGSGSLLVSIARSPNRVATDDRIPNDVEGHEAAARSTLQAGHNRGVGEVLLCWDELRVTGGFPKVSMNFYSRRCLRLAHPGPRAPLAVQIETDDIATTIVSPIFWNPPDGPLPRKDELPSTPAIHDAGIQITEAFRSKAELEDGFRAEQAIEAILDPDDRFDRDLETGSRIVLATRRQDATENDHTVVVFAAEIAGEGLSVHGAWRLFGSEPPQDALCGDARLAFQTCLVRYGLPVKIGALRDRLIEYTVSTGPVEIVRTGGRLTTFGVGRRLDSGAVEHRWVFCVDDDKYRAVSSANGFGIKARSFR